MIQQDIEQCLLALSQANDNRAVCCKNASFKISVVVVPKDILVGGAP